MSFFTPPFLGDRKNYAEWTNRRCCGYMCRSGKRHMSAAVKAALEAVRKNSLVMNKEKII